MIDIEKLAKVSVFVVDEEKQQPPAVDPERERFDHLLAERLTRKNMELIELRIELARADEAKRAYFTVLVFVIITIAWCYVWDSSHLV